ncbi:cytochrome c oxidase assembly factor Coa1 family protein [Flagellimonas onchidii]|uniref:cytochrome c oxidase assembly factor Coa1 family protein n=1 Tax=Flagellimonas onchidii TaxID=2562684 RepID=UPI0010A5D1F6|nr:cytochrome c oxidase assembly factor Coa1 family protein [Allomuricauda onchidii]
MDNELIIQKSWWKRNWKWFVPVAGTILILSFLFSSGAGDLAADMAKAYSNSEVYENALEKVKQNPKAHDILGEIKPMDKFAIFEGRATFIDNNKTLNTSVRINASKVKARMDIIAKKSNGSWIYQTINVRVKNPPEKRQTIAIFSAD